MEVALRLGRYPDGDSGIPWDDLPAVIADVGDGHSAPLRPELHARQTTRRLARAFVPPAASGTTWSTVGSLVGCRHRAQVGAVPVRAAVSMASR